MFTDSLVEEADYDDALPLQKSSLVVRSKRLNE